MMKHPTLLQKLARLLQRGPSPAEEAESEALSRAYLRALPEPEARAAERVRRRVRASLAAPPRSRLPLLLPPAVAAAGAIGLTLAARNLEPPPPPLALDIAIVATPDPMSVTPDVKMVADGRGQLYGTERTPRLQWSEGKVSLEVTPDKGIDLQVTTEEGTARVVGTGFTVERSAFGTLVTVAHGRVAVDCAAGPSALLQAGGSLECIPTRPSALLGRARAQFQRGDGVDAVLATLDLATRADNPSALAGEILATRVDMLYRAGRGEEAVAAAQRYLDEGHSPRRQEVRRIAAAVLLQSSGCSRAIALLEQAVAEGGTPEDAAALAACTAQR